MVSESSRSRFQSRKKPVHEEDEGYVVEPPVEEVWQDFNSLSEDGELAGAEGKAKKAGKAASGVEVPPDSTSFMQWAGLYVREVVEHSRSMKTAQAKRADLSRFVGFYLEVAGDDIRCWSPGVVAAFLEELSREVSPVTGRRYQGTTQARILATVRHFGRWVVRRRGLPGGDPCQGVAPPPGGQPLPPSPPNFTSDHLAFLRQAATTQCQRVGGLAWRDRVVLELLLIGLRPGELGPLRKSQLRSGEHPWRLVRLQRRSATQPTDLDLTPEAIEALTDYFREVRDRGPGWLLTSRQGHSLATRDVERAISRLHQKARVDHSWLPPGRITPTNLVNFNDSS